MGYNAYFLSHGKQPVIDSAFFTSNAISLELADHQITM